MSFIFFFHINIQSDLRYNSGANFESNHRFFQVSMQPDVPTCVAFLSLFHYFQLTNYFWMFVEGNHTFLEYNSRVSKYVTRIDFTFFFSEQYLLQISFVRLFIFSIHSTLIARLFFQVSIYICWS